MKRAFSLLIGLLCVCYCYSQPLVWHNYYAKDAGYGLVDVGNYIFSIRTNQLIKYQKSTGYFSYSTIPNDVLPCNSAHDSLATMFAGLAADNQGNLWLTTAYYNNVTWGDSVGHLYKYDGNSWTLFSPTLVTAGYTPAPRPVFDRSGNMWFIDSSRLVKYDGNAFTRWDRTNYPLLRWISEYDNFIIDTAGNFWDGIYGYGLLKFDGNSNFTLYDSTVFHTDPNGILSIANISCNPRDNKIYAIRAGVSIDTTFFVFDGTSWNTGYIDTALTSPYYGIHDIFWDNNNNTYYNYPGGLLKFDGNIYSVVSNLPQSNSGSYVRQIGLDPNGMMWVIANGIFCSFDGNTFTSFSDPKAVLPDNNMLPSILDNNGNPWFGFFRADGLTTFNGNAFSTVPVIGPITAMVKDQNGIFYLGSYGPNFIRSYNPVTGIVKNYPFPAGGTATDPVMGLTIDGNGTVWGVWGIDVSYNGLMKIQNDTVISIPNTYTGWLQGYYSSIAADANGNIWMGTYSDPNFPVGANPGSGILKYDGTDFTNYNTSNSGLPENEIGTITFGPSNKLWIATDTKGFTVYDGSTWMVYDTTNTSLPTNHIENFFFKNGKTLVATRMGFSIFDGTNWSTFTIDNSGLVNGDVESVLLDDNCNVWAATECGLSRLVGTCTGDNIIYGTVTEHTRAMVPNVDVYLMKLDAVHNKLVPIDNTVTDAAGNYQFATHDTDVYVYALPNAAQLTTILPSYNDTALVQQQASLIHVNGGIIQKNIVCHQPLANPGNLSLTGVVMAANTGNATDYRLYLMLNDEPVATCVTSIDGHFSFTNMAPGTYTIWVDKMGIDNGVAPSVTFTGNDTVETVLHDTFLEILTVGIPETTTKSLDIYPNPSHGRIMCTVTSDVSETAVMNVYDMNGMVVHETKVSNGTQTVDLSSLPNGIYIVRVVSSFATQQERLVIVK